MDCSEFFEENCETTEKENIVLFSCRNNKLQIDIDQRERHYIKLNVVFRYINPKVCVNTSHILEEELTDDFDSALEYLLEKNFKNFTLDLDSKQVYFLPSDLEKILKDVIHNNRTKNIPPEIERFIPIELLEKKSFKFEEVESKIINYEDINKYSVSFF